MRVAMIGSGYVGLVAGACLARCGVLTCCVDRELRRIESLQRCQVPIYEPGLTELITESVQAAKLSFSTDLAAAVAQAEVVFIAVGTPSYSTQGDTDLSFVNDAARELAPHLSGYTVVAIKSTVPVGCGHRIKKLIQQINPAADFTVCANPEFLREGSAIHDFTRPYRIVLGLDNDQRAAALLTELYRRLTDRPIVITSLQSAELIKYAANAFLASKIAFINQISDLCESVGADVRDVACGIGLDDRIGHQFLQVGPGYGGSCFPKDITALAAMAGEYGRRLSLVEATHTANEQRKQSMVERVIQACDGAIAGLAIAVLGVTFKPDTDDIRESPAMTIIPALQQLGAQLQVFDPAGMRQAAQQLSGISWKSNAYQALKDVDAAVIVTDWDEFRRLDLTKVRELMRYPVVVDLRNLYDPAEMARNGLRYSCLGRPGVAS